jgi:hypothetical protein
LPRPFKFEEFWTKDPYCGLVIQAVWDKPIFGPPAHCLTRKQFHTKESLKRWNAIHFGNIQKKIKATKAMIDKVQQLPLSPSSFSSEANLKDSLDELLIQEEVLWKSKSREI